jgi:hypothetical protein
LGTASSKFLESNDITVTKFLDTTVTKFLMDRDTAVTKFLEESDHTVSKFLSAALTYYLLDDKSTKDLVNSMDQQEDDIAITKYLSREQVSPNSVDANETYMIKFLSEYHHDGPADYHYWGNTHGDHGEHPIIPPHYEFGFHDYHPVTHHAHEHLEHEDAHHGHHPTQYSVPTEMTPAEFAMSHAHHHAEDAHWLDFGPDGHHEWGNSDGNSEHYPDHGVRYHDQAHHNADYHLFELPHEKTPAEHYHDDHYPYMHGYDAMHSPYGHRGSHHLTDHPILHRPYHQFEEQHHSWSEDLHAHQEHSAPDSDIYHEAKLHMIKYDKDGHPIDHALNRHADIPHGEHTEDPHRFHGFAPHHDSPQDEVHHADAHHADHDHGSIHELHHDEVLHDAHPHHTDPHHVDYGVLDHHFDDPDHMIPHLYHDIYDSTYDYMHHHELDDPYHTPIPEARDEFNPHRYDYHPPSDHFHDHHDYHDFDGHHPHGGHLNPHPGFYLSAEEMDFEEMEMNSLLDNEAMDMEEYEINALLENGQEEDDIEPNAHYHTHDHGHANKNKKHKKHKKHSSEPESTSD